MSEETKDQNGKANGLDIIPLKPHYAFPGKGKTFSRQLQNQTTCDKILLVENTESNLYFCLKTGPNS